MRYPGSGNVAPAAIAAVIAVSLLGPAPAIAQVLPRLRSHIRR